MSSSVKYPEPPWVAEEATVTDKLWAHLYERLGVGYLAFVAERERRCAGTFVPVMVDDEVVNFYCTNCSCAA